VRAAVSTPDGIGSEFRLLGGSSPRGARVNAELQTLEDDCCESPPLLIVRHHFWRRFAHLNLGAKACCEAASTFAVTLDQFC
jgi:hypothetical protein